MSKDNQHLSFEFYPPRTDAGKTQLQNCAEMLSAFSPNFFTVTFGAGGSTQAGTKNTVIEIQQATTITTIPHLSCLASSKSDVSELLLFYKSQNIKHIVALRGDVPSGMTLGQAGSDFQYGKDLVQFIRQHSGKHFYIFVACYPEFHPQTRSADSSFQYLKEKIDAGANCAITQYFYNSDAYFRYLDSCSKWNIDIPIIPGIMPITNFKQLVRFSDTCGAEIPRWIRFRLESYGDDLAAIRAFGEEVVTDLCAKLLSNGAPGLHFYTLNKSEATMTILKNLNRS